MPKVSRDTRRQETPLDVALRFAQTDLASISHRDLINLKSDIAEEFLGLARIVPADGPVEIFLGVGDRTAGIVPRPDSDPVEMTDKALAVLQAECRRLFLSWAGHVSFIERLMENWNAHRNDKRDRLLTNPLPDSFSSSFPVEFEIVREVGGGHGGMIAKGSVNDVFLFVLGLLLVQGGADELRVCIECREKLFIKTGRRRYCEDACMFRANKRAQRTGTATKRKVVKK